MYTEDQLLPISALQHLRFCRRQCALIHIEGLWAENRLTVEGNHLHEKTHDGKSETSSGVRIARCLYVSSLKLGLRGQTDVVEFPKNGPPKPVEYKRGKPKKDNCDSIQLCAQAMCLEHSLQCNIPVGEIFYGQTRRRVIVQLDTSLRNQVIETAGQLHDLISSGETPEAVFSRKCQNCSLVNLCLPYCGEARRNVKRYLGRNIFTASIQTPCQDTDLD